MPENDIKHLLQQMKDIHLPQEPAFWPPAPGWWILAALLLALLGFGLLQLVRHYNQQAPRRAALAELDKLQQRYDTTPAGTRQTATHRALVNDANAVLQRLLRAAEIADPTSPGLAPISDRNWISTLFTLDSGANPSKTLRAIFTPGTRQAQAWLREVDRQPLQHILEARFQQHSDPDAKLWIKFCKQWIKAHPFPLKGHTDKARTWPEQQNVAQTRAGNQSVLRNV